MQFLENSEILAVVLIIFRRLYNFFPSYRKHLEDPMILIFINVLKTFKKTMEDVNNQMPLKDKEIGQKLYESAQIYINFIMDSNHIP